jgi:hypothetical protein
VSRHLDTPLAAQAGQLYLDDLYVFPASGGAPDQEGRQPLQLHALTGGQARDGAADGELLLEGRTGEVTSGTAADLSGWRPEQANNSCTGFNGRTQADNAPEVMLSLVAGMAVPSGRRPSVAAAQRASDFPYVVPA